MKEIADSADSFDINEVIHARQIMDKDIAKSYQDLSSIYAQSSLWLTGTDAQSSLQEVEIGLLKVRLAVIAVVVPKAKSNSALDNLSGPEPQLDAVKKSFSERL